MIILIPWISFALHISVIGISVFSWISSITLAIFILFFALFKENSNFIKYVFLPISLISSASYNFYSSGIFATGFFKYCSLDLLCLTVFYFKFLINSLNLNKKIRIIDFLSILLFFYVS